MSEDHAVFFFLRIRRPPGSPLFPSTTLSRSPPSTTRCQARTTSCSSPACSTCRAARQVEQARSEEHTSELQAQSNVQCRLLLAKKKNPRSGPAGRERLQHRQIALCRGTTGAT